MKWSSKIKIKTCDLQDDPVMDLIVFFSLKKKKDGMNLKEIYCDKYFDKSNIA